MTSSTPSAAKLPTVKLGLGPMVVFNGAPEKFPWFWKKFRAYCMKKPDAWAVLSKQKGRRTQLSTHVRATGDTKRFFPIFEDRNANNTLTDAKYDAANQFIYSLWMDVLTEAAADLLSGVEEGDGMSITAIALARYQRDDLPAKMKVSFNLLSMKQAASETLETYTARNKACHQKVKDLKITLKDLLTALYLHGLSPQFHTPRDFLILQDNVSMDLAESKLSAFKNFHAASRSAPRALASPVVRAVTFAEPTTETKRKKCSFCGFSNHVESECRKKISAMSAIRKNPGLFRAQVNGNANSNPTLSVNSLVANDSKAPPPTRGNFDLDKCAWAYNPLLCLVKSEAKNNERSGSFQVFLDNCCSYNIWSGPSDDLHDFIDKASGYIPPPPITGAGDIPFVPSGSGWIFGFKFHYCPEIGANLLSQGHLQRLGYKFAFPQLQCAITNPQGNVVMEAKLNPSNVYSFDCPLNSARNALRNEGRLTEPIAQVFLCGGKPTNLAKHLYQKCGHPNLRLIQRMLKDGGYTKIKSVPASHFASFPACKGCVLGKGSRIPKNTAGAQPGRPQPMRPFQVCSLDLSGRISTKGLNNNGAAVYEYFGVLVDHFSGAKFALPCATRETIDKQVREFEEKKIKPFGFKLNHLEILHGDNEFDTAGVHALAAEKGFVFTFTVPHNSFLNPHAERGVGTLSMRSRTVILDSDIPNRFWPQALAYSEACELRLPQLDIKTGRWESPLERITGKRPNFSHLHRFGSRCWAGKEGQELKKGQRFSAVKWPCVYMGPSQSRPGGHFVYNEIKKKFFDRFNVVFDEGPTWSQHGLSTKKQLLDGLPKDLKDQLAPATTDFDVEDIAKDDPVTRPSRSRNPTPRFAPMFTFKTISDDEEKTTAAMSKPAEESKTAPAHHEYSLCEVAYKAFAAAEELVSKVLTPATFKQAMASPQRAHWLAGTKSELQSLRQYGVYTIKQVPPGTPLIQTKWVYRIKTDEHGKVTRYKVRLVAKGFTQREGIHFKATFAPVARLASFRTLLAVAANLGLTLRQLDFTCAYLHADLHEELWIRPPPGIQVPAGYGWKLNKALYGLRQAGREWYITLDKTIQSFGFHRCNADPCVYIRVNPNDPTKLVILLVYVDDVIMASNWPEAADKLVTELNKKFNVKDLGFLKWFLGMLITRDPKTGAIHISQAQYTEQLLKRFGFWDSKAQATPADPAKPLTNLPAKYEPTPAEAAEISKFPYREVIGSLLYAACVTRADISAVVGFLARAMSAPRLVHVQAAKRCMRYLRGTINHGLTYRKTSKPLFAHVDSNWAGDDERRSTSGYVFWLAGSLISWASKKQRSVSISSCEAEYYAASLAAAEAKWLRTLLAELQQVCRKATTIYEDNTGCIRLSKDPCSHTKSKHIAIRHHFVREAVEANIVELIYIKTTDNIADLFTKVLGKTNFKKFANTFMTNH